MRIFDLADAPADLCPDLRRDLRPDLPAAGMPPRTDCVALSHAARRSNRQLLLLADGESVGLITARGHVLRHGERRYSRTGDCLGIRAAPEPLLRASSASPLALSRAAWHLGNRHTAVEITPHHLQIQPDPVLHRLLAALGLAVEAVDAVFEPENGAYVGLPGDPQGIAIGGHRHGHDDTFADDHALAQTLYRQHHGGA